MLAKYLSQGLASSVLHVSLCVLMVMAAWCCWQYETHAFWKLLYIGISPVYQHNIGEKDQIIFNNAASLGGPLDCHWENVISRYGRIPFCFCVVVVTC